jgi:hypothetical protein
VNIENFQYLSRYISSFLKDPHMFTLAWTADDGKYPAFMPSGCVDGTQRTTLDNSNVNHA